MGIFSGGDPIEVSRLVEVGGGQWGSVRPGGRLRASVSFTEGRAGATRGLVVGGGAVAAQEHWGELGLDGLDEETRAVGARDDGRARATATGAVRVRPLVVGIHSRGPSLSFRMTRSANAMRNAARAMVAPVPTAHQPVK